ncbi:cell wall-binding repeat-containing protein [Bacillus licheniformis]|nr:cell wall-binding repeat-containing protein [Bacillus licheniformis]
MLTALRSAHMPRETASRFFNIVEFHTDSDKNAMKSKGTTSTIVVGGEVSISSSVYKQLASPTRIGGSNRYEVAANVVKKYYSSAKNAIISNGYAYADGLTGSVLAAKQTVR